jgi:hypothetical protein
MSTAESTAKFVAEYVQQCLARGINSPPKMREAALEEINGIDKEIARINDLKAKKHNLMAVIKNLGGGDSNKSEEPPPDWNTPEKLLKEDFRDLCVKICDEVERSHPRGVETSRIVQEVASIVNHKRGYSAVQWLGYNKIIDRDPESRLVIIGPNWKSRPTDEDNQSQTS